MLNPRTHAPALCYAQLSLLHAVHISKHPELIRLVDTSVGEDLQTLIDVCARDKSVTAGPHYYEPSDKKSDILIYVPYARPS